MVVLFNTIFLSGLETDVRSFRSYKSRLSAMVFRALRIGWTEHHSHNKINDCKAFIGGPYPNLSKLILVELTQLKFTIEDNYVVIQNKIAESRDEIETFLLAQWRGHHENVVSSSIPSETCTLDRVCRYFNVKNCETQIEKSILVR
jgi:hypothetical protein